MWVPRERATSELFENIYMSGVSSNSRESVTRGIQSPPLVLGFSITVFICFRYCLGHQKKRAESPRTHHWPLTTSSGLRGFGILEILHKFPNQSYFKTPKWAVGTTYSVVECVLSVLSTHKRDCKVDQAAYWPQSEFEISPVPKKEQIRKKILKPETSLFRVRTHVSRYKNMSWYLSGHKMHVLTCIWT